QPRRGSRGARRGERARRRSGSRRDRHVRRGGVGRAGHRRWRDDPVAAVAATSFERRGWWTMTITEPEISKNAWRIGTPGIEGWTRTARPGDPHKYFMVSADCHVTESLAFLETIEPEYRERVPRV